MTEMQKIPMPMRAMSSRDFAMWGAQDVAYVKRVMVNEDVAWSIHGADGANIGMTHDRELAFAAVRQHELEPLSVH